MFFVRLFGRSIRLFSSSFAYSDTPKTDFSLSGAILIYSGCVAYSVLHSKDADVLIRFGATRKNKCCHSVAYALIHSLAQDLTRKTTGISQLLSFFIRFSMFYKVFCDSYLENCLLGHFRLACRTTLVGSNTFKPFSSSFGLFGARSVYSHRNRN